MAAMNGFRIFRAQSSDGNIDPLSKFCFQPPLESDELFDALRIAYPELKTHTERKKRAVLDFLVKEREDDLRALDAMVNPEQSTAAQLPMGAFGQTNTVHQQLIISTDASNLSPTQSRSSNSDYSPRNDSFNQPSPAFLPTPSSTTSKATAPAFQVWDPSSDKPVKLHSRRRMTDQEKEEYRRRRILGSCDSCKQKRRKVGSLITLKLTDPPLTTAQCRHMTATDPSKSKVCKKAKTSVTSVSTTPLVKAGSSTGSSNNSSPIDPFEMTPNDITCGQDIFGQDSFLTDDAFDQSMFTDMTTDFTLFNEPAQNLDFTLFEPNYSNFSYSPAANSSQYSHPDSNLMLNTLLPAIISNDWLASPLDVSTPFSRYPQPGYGHDSSTNQLQWASPGSNHSIDDIQSGSGLLRESPRGLSVMAAQRSESTAATNARFGGNEDDSSFGREVQALQTSPHEPHPRVPKQIPVLPRTSQPLGLSTSLESHNSSADGGLYGGKDTGLPEVISVGLYENAQSSLYSQIRPIPNSQLAGSGTLEDHRTVASDSYSLSYPWPNRLRSANSNSSPSSDTSVYAKEKALVTSSGKHVSDTIDNVKSNILLNSPIKSRSQPSHSRPHPNSPFTIPPTQQVQQHVQATDTSDTVTGVMAIYNAVSSSSLSSLLFAQAVKCATSSMFQAMDVARTAMVAAVVSASEVYSASTADASSSGGVMWEKPLGDIGETKYSFPHGLSMLLSRKGVNSYPAPFKLQSQPDGDRRKEQSPMRLGMDCGCVKVF
jgi:hypothetical protein